MVRTSSPERVSVRATSPPAQTAGVTRSAAKNFPETTCVNKIVVSVGMSSRRASTVPAGNAAKASSVGAKTVNGPSPARAPSNSAATTAAQRVWKSLSGSHAISAMVCPTTAEGAAKLYTHKVELSVEVRDSTKNREEKKKGKRYNVSMNCVKALTSVSRQGRSIGSSTSSKYFDAMMIYTFSYQSNNQRESTKSK